MTAGMAGVIAAHWLSEQNDRMGDPGWTCGCDASGTTSTFVDGHAAHVAEELAKTGHGNVQEAPRIVHYAGNVRQVGHTGAPEGWSTKAWHESAYGDTGEGYSLPGRLYVIQCAWCEAVFIANTKAESMILYRKHEDDMQTPDPLAAALADTEGHALVKAIHDRKAEA